MPADTVSIMGIFSSEQRAALAIDGLRETPWIIEQVYSLRSIRMFPLAVEFILPENMAGVTP